MKIIKPIIYLFIFIVSVNCQALKLAVIKTKEINSQLITVLGGGGNSAVLFSKDLMEVLIVDTKNGIGAKKLKKIIDKRAPNAKITIINTHFHNDHVGGNKLYYSDNNVIKHIIGNYTSDQWQNETAQAFRGTAQIIASNDHVQLFFGGENVHIFSQGQGHTWSDIIVYFERANTLLTGDLVFNEFHPVIDVKAGADIDSWIYALDEILIKFDDIKIVPGHGDITDINAVKKQRKYLKDLKNVRDKNSTWSMFKEKYKHLHSIPFFSGFKCSKKVIELKAGHAE